MKYNTECVFEVIGNYPVVDQFDIFYPSLLSGSTQDNYVTGSMFTRAKLGNLVLTTQGNRRLAFSKLGVDRTSKPDGTYSTSELQKISYVTQPWYERAGTLKNIKIFSDAERYDDSYLPNLKQVVARLGGELYWFDPDSSIALFIGRAPFPEFVDGFNESFPYEPKFANINRMSENLSLFEAEKQYTLPGLPTIPTKKSKKLLIFSHAGFLVPPAGDETMIWGTTAPEDYSKILFGFGDLKTQEYNLIDTASYKSVDTPTWRTVDFSGGSGFPLAYGPVIRGWKYGLASGNPKYTGAVFRRNKFGQFRDMLEQRETPKGRMDYEYSPFRHLGSVEQPAVPKAEITNDRPVVDIADFTVKVMFHRKSYNSATKTISYDPVNPEQTMSSNLSIFATSSLPFFDDGISRNRLSRVDNLIGNNVKIGLAFDLNNPIIT